MENHTPKSKKCRTCDGSGYIEVPFSYGLTRESCPLCSGKGEIEKKQKKAVKTLLEVEKWCCPRSKYGKKPTLVDGCEESDCAYFEYCSKLKIPKKKRPRLSRDDTFKRSHCWFYLWTNNQCLKKDFETNRIICATCPDHIERSRWKIIFHLNLF